MDKNKVMRWGCLYKDIYINKGSEAYAERYKEDADYEVFTPDILTLVFIISNVYIDVAKSNITRVEGSRRQKEIFSIFNPEADYYGLDKLSWESTIKEAA